LWVPGGPFQVMQKMMLHPNSAYFTYLKQVAKKATWVCSVCEGALLLARAGLLDGYRATTHWAVVGCLQKFPKVKVVTNHPRFVVSKNRLTGAGISAGLDEALKLIILLFDKKTAIDVQQTTQYFPRPPVHGTIPPTPSCPIHW
jgi:transcriptional regulator GlxA family with amidase domain